MTDQPRPDSPPDTTAPDATPTPAGEVASPPAAPEDPATLAAQRDEYRDLLLRKTAEFDNYRKRIERERRELASHAAADLLEELLPLVDDLERALQAEVTGKAAHAYRAGVELIHKQLLDLLAKRGVTPIESLGQRFDPHLHQAIAREASTGHPADTITAELRRGYMLGDRLLRASMVKVATG